MACVEGFVKCEIGQSKPNEHMIGGIPVEEYLKIGTSDKNEYNKFLCCECANFYPEFLMQKYDCSVCGGRKCANHTTISEVFECKDCGKGNLCVDCLHLGRCCE